MYNPEQALLRKRENSREELSAAEEAVYKWYLENIEFREKRKLRNGFGDMNEFSEIYGKEEIEGDKQKVRNLRNSEMEKDKTQRGEMFEAIIGKHGETANWFGDMQSFETSEYDDRINHTDLVFWGKTRRGEDVFLGIDCTVSENQENIEKKISRIAKDIKKNRLTEIKYYKHPETEELLGLKNIPRVVIYINQSNFKKLCQIVVKVNGRERGSNEELANSEIKKEILEQIKKQLENQLNLAQGKSEEINKNIQKALDKITEIIAES